MTTLTDVDDGASKGLTAVEVFREFRGLILSGQLGRREKLPTVRQAAADLGVAPGTISKAYKLLAEDGLIESRVGAGTRVSDASGVLPKNIVLKLRELAELIEIEGVDLDDVTDALGVISRE